jgi:hypothetical protein
VATEDIPNGTVLLSVPLEQVFQSQVCLHPAPLMVFSLSAVPQGCNFPNKYLQVGSRLAFLTPFGFLYCCNVSSKAADELELHWAAEMALRLLQARHASRHQHDGSSSSSSSSGSPGSWAPWVDSLPQHVVTPVEFTTEEVEQLVIPSTVQVRRTAWSLNFTANYALRPALKVTEDPVLCFHTGSQDAAQ